MEYIYIVRNRYVNSLGGSFQEIAFSTYEQAREYYDKNKEHYSICIEELPLDWGD